MSPVLLQLSLAEHLRPQRYFARSCRISAVKLARAFSNTFAGIRLQDVPGFVAAQFGGALAATALFRSLLPDLSGQAQKVLIPHPTEVAGSRTTMKMYVFACVHNAGRSQIASAFFNLYAQPGCQ